MDHPSSSNQLALSDASSKNVEDHPGSPQPEVPEPPMEEPLQPYIQQDRDYGCKYCTKKFSSKQALGGHYNAHKAERALEKTVRELHDIRYGLFGAGGVAYPSPFLGSYFRSHDFVDRPVFNNFPYNAGNPYAPARPVPGFNNVYPGWVAPGPRVPQFPNIGAGDGSSSSRSVDPDLSVFAAPMNEQQDEDESGLDLSLKL